MSEPFLGEIRMFAGNFAPRGYAFCDGQLLPIAQNDALFALFGTTYGGDGRTTVALPDLRGRVPIHYGSGPGLTPRPLGQRGGQYSVVLTPDEMPQHQHALRASTNPATNAASPDGGVTADAGGVSLYAASTSPADMNAAAVLNTGGSRLHGNIAPSLAIVFIVALVGIFPSRS